MIMSSLTSRPAPMMCCTSRPSFVLAATASRSMSPVELFGMPYCLQSSAAWVPLPAPGGPIITRFSAMRWSRPCRIRAPSAATAADARLLHEPVVVPHDELRFHLLHRVHRHADDDQQRRAAEIEGHVHAGGEPLRQDRVQLLADERNRRDL